RGVRVELEIDGYAARHRAGGIERAVEPTAVCGYGRTALEQHAAHPQRLGRSAGWPRRDRHCQRQAAEDLAASCCWHVRQSTMASSMSSQISLPAAMLVPLQHRTFAVLWSATLAANIGAMIQTVAAAWVMLSIAHSPDQVVLVQTAATLPCFCFSLIAGALADTIDRRHIMLCAQSVTIAAATGLAVLAAFGGMSPWILLGGTFIIGSGAAVNAPTWESMVNDQVPREQIAAAVALNALSFNTARTLGPALGGALLAVGSPAMAFSVNALVACALFAAVYGSPPSRIAHHLPREPLVPAVASGLRYVMLSPQLRSLMIRCCLFGFCGTATLALLPLVAR